MKNNYEWRKRRIKYKINNNAIGKIFMRLYYEFEELIWLGGYDFRPDRIRDYILVLMYQGTYYTFCISTVLLRSYKQSPPLIASMAPCVDGTWWCVISSALMAPMAPCVDGTWWCVISSALLAPMAPGANDATHD
jgi:hypothetical protein